VLPQADNSAAARAASAVARASRTTGVPPHFPT
jgi:hypothetical protein